MDKIKKFIDVFVPVYICNFKCDYCYISTWESFKQRNATAKIPFSAKKIREGLSIKRWGGPLMLNFCAAGETLLCNELLDIIKELLEEGHYCMIVTNGSVSKKFDELCKLPLELRERLFIKFSLHYLELKKLKLVDAFFENVKKMHENGISYTVELTPSDIYIPYIDEIKEVCLERIGAYPHITVCREENGKVPIMSKLSREVYIKTWSTFNSELFNFKMEIFNVKRKEFCYAGAWSYSLSLLTGDLQQCYRGKTLQNIFEDTESPIKEEPIGCHCIDAHCWNGHAFLAFGDIVELETPTFESERNRKTKNGPWITSKMSHFMKTKLFDSNRVLTAEEKKKYNSKSKMYYIKKLIKGKVKSIIKKK